MDLNPKQRDIITALHQQDGRATVHDINIRTGLDAQTVNNHLRSLKRNDLVEVVGYLSEGEWHLGGQPPKILELSGAGRREAESPRIYQHTQREREIWDAIKRLEEEIDRLHDRLDSVVDELQRVD